MKRILHATVLVLLAGCVSSQKLAGDGGASDYGPEEDTGVEYGVEEDTQNGAEAEMPADLMFEDHGNEYVEGCEEPSLVFYPLLFQNSPSDIGFTCEETLIEQVMIWLFREGTVVFEITLPCDDSGLNAGPVEPGSYMAAAVGQNFGCGTYDIGM